MPQTIRAKFKCQQVARVDAGGSANGPMISEQVALHPVYGPANEPWSKYTPSGRLEMTITNPLAHGAFVPGKSYYLDISPAED